MVENGAGYGPVVRHGPRTLAAMTIGLLALVVLGTVTLGLTKAGHAAVEQHLSSEAVTAATTGDTDRHDHGHLEHTIHVLGACAAVLAAAGLAALFRPRASIRLEQGAAAAGRVCRPHATDATRADRLPARLAFCVQLC